MIDYKNVIKQKRIQMGISQNKLAKSVGITQAFMNEIESGRKKPSVDVLLKICEELQIPMFGENNIKD